MAGEPRGVGAAGRKTSTFILRAVGWQLLGVNEGWHESCWSQSLDLGAVAHWESSTGNPQSGTLQPRSPRVLGTLAALYQYGAECPVSGQERLDRRQRRHRHLARHHLGDIDQRLGRCALWFGNHNRDAAIAPLAHGHF